MVALLFVRTFLLRPYYVTTTSMEPTIHGAVDVDGKGEHVLVRFGGAEGLSRFDLVVIDRGEGGAPVVKRVGGLPGDRFQLAGGDLFVNGRRIPADVPRPDWIPVFDSHRGSLADAFDFRDAPAGVSSSDRPWVLVPETPGELRLEALGLEPGRESGLLRFHSDLRDSFINGAGVVVDGKHQVNDLMLAFDFRITDLSPGGRVRARIVEEGDTFEAILEVDETLSGFSLRIERNPAEVLGANVADRLKPPGSGEGTWLRLEFSNRDNHLSARLTETETGASLCSLGIDYEANRPYLGGSANPGGMPLKSVASRVALGGEALEMELRNVLIARDLFWIPVGTYAVDQPFELSPKQYFLLGDNSANSADSRLWGPVGVEAIIGRPLGVIWPPGRRRSLR